MDSLLINYLNIFWKVFSKYFPMGYATFHYFSLILITKWNKLIKSIVMRSLIPFYVDDGRIHILALQTSGHTFNIFPTLGWKMSGRDTMHVWLKVYKCSPWSNALLKQVSSCRKALKCTQLTWLIIPFKRPC